MLRLLINQDAEQLKLWKDHAIQIAVLKNREKLLCFVKLNPEFVIIAH